MAAAAVAVVLSVRWRCPPPLCWPPLVTPRADSGPEPAELRAPLGAPRADGWQGADSGPQLRRAEPLAVWVFPDQLTCHGCNGCCLSAVWVRRAGRILCEAACAAWLSAAAPGSYAEFQSLSLGDSGLAPLFLRNNRSFGDAT